MHLDRTETYRVGPERLWPLIANTDSLNREVGMSEIDYAYAPLPQGGSTMTAAARTSSLPMEWVEHPFEWIRPREYSSRRVFTRGPFHEFRARVEVAPEPGGCRLRVAVDLEPAGVIGRILAATAGRKSITQMLEAARRFERFLLGEAPTPWPNRFGRAPVDAAELDAAIRRLKEWPVDPALADRLGRFVAEEVDERVRDMAPHALADEWKADRAGVLRLCLWATRAGLLDLRWHVLCPACRGSKAEHDALSRLSPEHECSSCNLRFRVDLDRRVRLRFTPPPSIRPVARGQWCAGGPMNTPHVHAQFVLARGEQRSADLSFPPGSYAVRRAGSLDPIPLRIGEGPPEAEAVLREGPHSALALSTPGRLLLRNEAGAPIRVTVEREEEEEETTAAEVTSLQEFRDLYATEALAPGVELSVGSLALLFSDLRNSTVLYERIGDAAAYGVVRRHFDFMKERIARHGGAVVKTMGDAVMAVFRRPADAVRGALAIQQGRAAGDPVIKLGLHCGPCLAVTTVDYLDYFGSTVNVAARAQAQSAGGDVVVTDAVMSAPGVAEAVRQAGARDATFTASLKGFETDFTLHRLLPGPAKEAVRGSS